MTSSVLTASEVMNNTILAKNLCLEKKDPQ